MGMGEKYTPIYWFTPYTPSHPYMGVPYMYTPYTPIGG